MIVFPTLVALATIGVGAGTAIALRRLPTLRLQLVGFGFLAAGLPLGAVLLSGLSLIHI